MPLYYYKVWDSSANENDADVSSIASENQQARYGLDQESDRIYMQLRKQQERRQMVEKVEEVESEEEEDDEAEEEDAKKV